MKSFFKFLFYLLAGFAVTVVILKLLGKNIPEEEEVEDEE